MKGQTALIIGYILLRACKHRHSSTLTTHVAHIVGQMPHASERLCCAFLAFPECRSVQFAMNFQLIWIILWIFFVNSFTWRSFVANASAVGAFFVSGGLVYKHTVILIVCRVHVQWFDKQKSEKKSLSRPFTRESADIYEELVYGRLSQRNSICCRWFRITISLAERKQFYSEWLGHFPLPRRTKIAGKIEFIMCWSDKSIGTDVSETKQRRLALL